MAQWSNTDNANGSVLWGVAGLNKAPNTANRDALYGNTTTDAYFTGSTIGQFGVDASEMHAIRASGYPKPAHTGWVLRTEGTGGRAGRVQQEVLVAMGSLGASNADNSVYPDNAIVITTQPTNKSGSASNNDVMTFAVVANLLVADGNTISYQWKSNTGSGFANVTDGATYANSTTATLTVFANTIANGASVMCLLTSNATPVSVNSAAATVTVTA